jgi:hypothetical protein
MMLAQRYPDAYDGIHASAPAISWNQILASSFWPQLFMDLIGYFPRRCELDAVTAAAVRACDSLDGIKDGIISDDAACDIDPMSIVGSSFFCSDTNTTMLISDKAAMIANATWRGPRTDDGKFIWFGPNIGSQLSGSTTALNNDIGPAMTSCSKDGTCTGVPLGLGERWIKYWIESRADWSYTNMTVKRFSEYIHESTQRYESVIGSNDPNLSTFYKKGGKILGYHGMVSSLLGIIHGPSANTSQV